MRRRAVVVPVLLKLFEVCQMILVGHDRVEEPDLRAMGLSEVTRHGRLTPQRT